LSSPSRGGGKEVSPGPATSEGPAVAQKYKIHQNAPLQRKFLKNPQMGPPKMFSPGPAVAFDGPCP